MNNTEKIILDEKIIMIVRGVGTEKLPMLTEAMWRGGIRLMECTYDASGRTPDEVIADGIESLVRGFSGRMCIGAGTVLKSNQVRLTGAAGGRFIISPDTNEDIITETKSSGLISIPGALTPTEAMHAHRAGADFVKLFPVSQLGASYVKALSAPLSHIRFLAVGGVGCENLPSLLSAGAVGVGIGLNDRDREAIERNDFEHVETKCRKLTETVRAWKELSFRA